MQNVRIAINLFRINIGFCRRKTLALHEARCVHDSMNRPKMNLLLTRVVPEIHGILL